MGTYTFATSGRGGKGSTGTGSAGPYGKYERRKFSIDKDGNKHPRTVEVIGGDIDHVTSITESMHADGIKNTFCPAVIGLTIEESERLSDAEVLEMGEEYLEHLCYPLTPDQVAYSIVKHKSTETGRIDLHITIAQQDLITGMNFYCFVKQRGDMHRLKNFSDLQQITHDLDDPRDPARADLVKRFAQATTQAQMKNTVADILEQMHVRGLINSRADVITELEKMNFEITRQGKTYISIKSPDMKKAMRLKGDMFHESYRGFGTTEERLEQSAQRNDQNREERIADLLHQLEQADAKRSGFFDRITSKENTPSYRDMDKRRSYSASTACSISQSANARSGQSDQPSTGRRADNNNYQGQAIFAHPELSSFELDAGQRRFVEVTRLDNRDQFISSVDPIGRQYNWKNTDQPAVFKSFSGTLSPASQTESSYKAAGALAASQWKSCSIDAKTQDKFDSALTAIVIAGGRVTSGTIAGQPVPQSHIDELSAKALKPICHQAMSMIMPSAKPVVAVTQKPVQATPEPSAMHKTLDDIEAEEKEANRIATRRALFDAAGLDQDGNEIPDSDDDLETPEVTGLGDNMNR